MLVGERVKEQEQELRCLNVNELRDASRSCNLWTPATVAAHCFRGPNLEEGGKPNGERRRVVHVCTNGRERRERGEIET